MEVSKGIRQPFDPLSRIAIDKEHLEPVTQLSSLQRSLLQNVDAATKLSANLKGAQHNLHEHHGSQKPLIVNWLYGMHLMNPSISSRA